MRETGRAWTCALLCAALLAGRLAPLTHAQERKRKPVVVSFGQPSIWSLEQAHYLLARMHQENLELRASSLAALDPNETHGRSINILRQMLGIGVEFDDTIRFQNSRRTRNIEFNDQRRLELISERDQLRNDRRSAKLDINRLELERARMTADNSTEAERAAKDAELKRRRDDLTVIEADIDTHNTDITALGTQPTDAPTAPTPAAPTGTPNVPSGFIDDLTKEEFKKLAAPGNDPRLNATTRLDNHVQMQYEIIAKQLTLLRDEVGPGERLVFLELPQSIYTTPGRGDEKMAQAWWHVNGYTKTDPLLRLLLELYEVERQWYDIQQVPLFDKFHDDMKRAKGKACDVYAATVTARKEAERARKEWQEELERWERAQYQLSKAKQADSQRGQTPSPKPTPPAPPEKITALTVNSVSKEPVAFETFLEFQCEYENARNRLIWDLSREARKDFARAQQGGARDTSEMVEAIKELVGVEVQGSNPERNRERLKDAQGEIRRSVKQNFQNVRSMTEEEKKDLRAKLYAILSDPERNIGPKDEYKFLNGMEFVRTDGRADRGDSYGIDDEVGTDEIESRVVRTVDIIPRQSSLNINDIQSTVKATGILAAFKFLFGFAGQVNFQRQREQFEQFIHQELYASGFGKGNRDFGWTFGALPGTKRVAPGVRTTYAVLVVPDDAESLVLSARGCYFPRKSYQPLDFEDTTHKDWDRENKFRDYNCGDEQTYIVPIPGGGDRSNFWVTNVDYMAAADGNRATVSIRGKNFSTQMGVLVNGVPLWPAVGLAQPLLAARARTDADKAAAELRGLALPRQNCAGEQNAGQGAGQNAAQNSAPKVCGDYERIDPEQIVVSFTLRDTFKGIPTITLVAPGKAVDVNTLTNITVNGVRNMRLADADFVFGARERPRIDDLKVFPVGTNSTNAYALLTGANFDPTDEVYVNGKPLNEWSPAMGGAAPAEYKQFRSDKLYRLIFDMPPGDKVSVTVRKTDSAPVTREFTKPTAKEVP